jgi:hypothetical protein
MAGERKTLDFEGLDDFAPRSPVATPPQAERKAVDQVAAFPSRERPDEAQMNIKAPAAILERFRRMAKKERYKHGEFLEILMDAYEGRGGGGT